jgi:hypothetical protein
MPTLPPSTRVKLIAAASGVAALVGIAALTFSSGEYNHTTNDALEDAGMSRSYGASRVTDLMTAIVEPGAEVITGVTLPLGWRVVDIAPAGMFAILEQKHVDGADGTWYEVRARNDGLAPMRFVGFVEFTQVESPPLDGGL